MPKSKQQKKEILESLIEKLENSKAVTFFGFQGLKVKEIEELRKTCRENNLDYLVTKKTLLKIALDKLGVEISDPEVFAGEVAAVFSPDEVLGAKVVSKFAKSHEAVVLKGGILERKIIGQKDVMGLAKLPGKEELLAKMVGSIKAPVNGLVNVLAGNLRGLVQVLNAIKESKG